MIYVYIRINLQRVIAFGMLRIWWVVLKTAHRRKTHIREDSMKTSRISRIMQILTTLQAEKSFAISDLSKMFGTSRRTIFRDLKELQTIGVPYHYDTKTGGYTIEPEFFLPPADLNLQEALNLLLLTLKLSKQIQLPSPKSTLLAALKIENNLPAKIRQYCNKALQNVSVKANPQVEIESLDKVFSQLLIAVQNKKIVNIRYYLPRERNSVLFDLSPYHLLYSNPIWYVVGKSSLHRKVRPFKLSRIKAANVLDKCFVADKEFDIREFLGRAWSMVPEGRLYHVKLRFLPEVANDVAEVQWHNTQKVTFEDDGSAIIEFRVDGLSEITWWILSYGDKVEVLAPRTLREKITKIAQRMVKTNQQESHAR